MHESLAGHGVHSFRVRCVQTSSQSMVSCVVNIDVRPQRQQHHLIRSWYSLAVLAGLAWSNTVRDTEKRHCLVRGTVEPRNGRPCACEVGHCKWQCKAECAARVHFSQRDNELQILGLLLHFLSAGYCRRARTKRLSFEVVVSNYTVPLRCYLFDLHS